MAASRLTTFLDTFDPAPKRRGTQWEHVCKWFLETDPVYRAQLKKVWLWDKWPGRWGPDTGIDLVAQAKDGTLWAIQAKAYAPENTVTKKQMDSFLTASGRSEFAHRLLIATTGHVSSNADHACTHAVPPVSKLLRHQLEHREGRPWPVSYAAWAKGRIPKAKPKRPYPHVRKAVRATLQQLKTHDRGQVIMACGTGKTLTALWVHEGLPSSRTLVLVPSLSLLGQTLQEWVGNAKTPFDTLPVCSDDTVRRGEDDALMSSTLDLGYPSTTDPDDVRTFLKRRGPRVVFATYHSSPVIADALAKTRLGFDLVIADEAHRCAGVVSSAFSTVLDPKKIPARKRIFMTATQRYYTGRLVNAAREDDHDVASMDDETVFGPVFHRLTFGHAIEQKLLSDYRVVIVGISDDQYRTYADEGRFLKLEGTKQTDARTLAAHIGLAKTMRTYDIKRVISFHGRVAGAKDFATEVPDIIDWMPRRERPSGTIWAEAVSGKMAAGDRMARLDRLRAVDTGERGILSNARCLGEGIDVPTLDGIAFIDPKHSQVDIVQAVGRAIRKGDGTKTATIVVPVFVNTKAADEDHEAVLDASAYQAIASVLRAMRDHDDALGEILDGLRRGLGARKKPRLPKDKVVLDLPATLKKDFINAIHAHVIRLTTSSWEDGFGHLLAYVQAEGHAQVLANHRTVEGHGLGTWVVAQRSKQDSLSADRRQRLEALEGWLWDPHAAAWDEGFVQLTAYVEAEGHARVPQTYCTATGFGLGAWVARQRRDKTKNRLSADRRQRLEALDGWVWDAQDYDAAWDEGFAQLTAYVQAEGHARVPQTYCTATGFGLGAWVRNQRSKHDSLSADRQQRLEALDGWMWDAQDYDAAWDEMFAQLTAYVQAEGHARVPRSYRTASGSRLGEWIQNQRTKKDRLSVDRRQRLEALKNPGIGCFLKHHAGNDRPTTVPRVCADPDEGAGDTRGRRSRTRRLQIPQADQVIGRAAKVSCQSTSGTPRCRSLRKPPTVFTTQRPVPRVFVSADSRDNPHAGWSDHQSHSSGPSAPRGA